MYLPLEQLSTNNTYHLLTQAIIPRPIAWVLSLNANGNYNLAPFSFFNAVCSNPPLVVLSIGKKPVIKKPVASHNSEPEQPYKDTYVNLTSGREFVIHLPGLSQAQAVTASAATLDYGVSELDFFNAFSEKDLQEKVMPEELVEFADTGLHRLKNAPIAFQARLHQVHHLGADKQAVIYAELMQAYIDDSAIEVDELKQRYYISPEKIAPLARLGGAKYAGLGASFSIQRPK